MQIKVPNDYKYPHTVKLDTDGSVIGHVPDGLAAILAPLLDSGTETSDIRRNDSGST